jgi:AcrR family transcriptional regulator
MAERAPVATRTRRTLTRDRVLAGAVALADEIGVHALTLRRLAQHLGVSPMAIYHHVADKEQILDGMVDAVFTEMDLPAETDGWRDAMLQRARAARRVRARHHWAVGLLDSRRHPGPATLQHHDWVIGQLREGGFSVTQTAHAFALLDSFVYGFMLQEASLPFDAGSAPPEELMEQMREAAQDYPYLMEMATHSADPGYSFSAEFEVGLALVLDGLDSLRTRSP